MVSRAWMSILAASALMALAGCTSQATERETPIEQTSTSTLAGADGAPAGDALSSEAVERPPAPLYLLPDMTLSDQGPAGERAEIALPTPVNSPFTEGVPGWTGLLPADVDLPAGASFEFTFYVTTNSASVPARNLPPFVVTGAPWADFMIYLRVGGSDFRGQATGPDYMTLGDVHEVTAVLTQEGAVNASRGDPVGLHVVATYTHAHAVAEFRFVIGPGHPAHLRFAEDRAGRAA